MRISTEYTSSLFLALSALQAEIGEIPQVFMPSESEEEFGPSEKDADDINDMIRPKGVGFDVNRFLDVFDKIELRKGTLLDYAFYYGGIGGRPLIYTRKVNAPRISANEYIKQYEHLLRANSYLDDIVIENDPESFFQLVVFTKIVHQFYQWWHAAYNDDRFVFDIKSVQKILRNIPETDRHGINNKNRDKLKHISFEPQVGCNDVGGKVRCILFSKRAGFYYENATIAWPKIKIKIKRKTIVPYHCGILF